MERGPARLCEGCAELTAMTGAGIMLMSGDVPQGSICSSDAVSALIEDLQYTLGEGPCVDAYEQERPVLEPDLSGAGMSRWAAFTPGAVRAGARAVFGFPLQVGAVRIGALNLYRDAPGPLDDEQHADALVLASVAARAVLGMQAGAPTGMLAAQLEVSVAEALIRLRGYAFAHDRPLRAVAEDVVARRLRLPDGSGFGQPGQDGRST